MKRQIILIDESLCDGCGQCAEACPEGAIQIIDDKARLISDIFCDGLGACISDCPVGAISIEEREAEEYDERKVMKNVMEKGENTVIAHLRHLKDHGETGYLKEALDFLEERGMTVNLADSVSEQDQPEIPMAMPHQHTQERAHAFAPSEGSALGHWPIQLHLISPNAPQYRGADLVLSADCVAYASGEFHKEFLKGRSLAIACPKLDSSLDRYIEKLIALIDESKIRTITVVTMEVPCCQGLTRLVEEAMRKAERKVPVELVVLSTDGQVINRDWLNLE